jgi:hypothetical protein
LEGGRLGRSLTARNTSGSLFKAISEYESSLSCVYSPAHLLFCSFAFLSLPFISLKIYQLPAHGLYTFFIFVYVTSSPPPEILAQIFYFTLKVKGKYNYSFVPFSMVNNWWLGVTYHQLYRLISMGTRPRLNMAGMLCCTLSKDPQIAALVIEL